MNNLFITKNAVGACINKYYSENTEENGIFESIIEQNLIILTL